MIWEIYSYWNIRELHGVFEAIAMLTSTDDYSTLLGTALLFGLIAAGIAVLIGAQDLIGGFRWFLMAIFLYFVLFVPKADVALIDRTGTVPAQITSNVPLSIAIFGHVSSKVGDWLTTSYETTMKVITPNYANDGVSFENNGLLFGEKVIIAAENARSENIAFRLNMTGFFEKCVFPEFDTGNISITDVLKSSDMWAQLSNVNPSLYVQLYNADGSPTPSPIACDVAYNSALPAVIANTSSDITKRMAGKLYPDQSDAIANASLQSALTGSYSYYLNVSENSTDIIKQKVLTNTFFDATANQSVVTASAMTEAGAKLNYGVLYNVAQNTIPKLRNVIEVILYAVFPIILLMMIVGGTQGVAVIKAYFIGLMWIQLWAPLYSVMNYLISSYDQKEMLARVEPGAELAAWHSNELQAQILGSGDIAGMLAVAIPMIAYAIIKGGQMAMTSFVSGATRPMESNAGMSSREVSQGNISMGNNSMDNNSFANTNAMKHDMQPSTNNGPRTMMGEDGQKYTTMANGSKAHDSTATESKGAFHNFTSAKSERDGYARESEQAMQASHNSSVQAGMETGSSFARAGLLSSAASGGKQWSEGFGNSYSTGTQEAFKTMNETAQGLEASGKVSQGQGAELMTSMGASVKAGLSLDAGGLAEFKAGAGKKYSSEAISSAADSIKSIDKNDLSSAATIMSEASENDSFQKNMGMTEDARTELKGGHSRSESLKEDSRAQLEESNSYKEKQSHAEERVSQAMIDLGAATPFNSMSEASQNFASGGGAGLLGQAMEARSQGDMQGAASYMDEFHAGADRYASEMDSPQPTGITGTGSQQDVLNTDNSNQAQVRGEVPGNQTAVGADAPINQAENKINDIAGALAVEEKWNKDEQAFQKEGFTEQVDATQNAVKSDNATLADNKQVDDLDGVGLDANGHQMVENSQVRDVSDAGGNDIVQTAENVFGPDSAATEYTQDLVNKLQTQADTDPGHTAPGSGVAGTEAFIPGPKNKSDVKIPDVPTRSKDDSNSDK
jgi:conjugal transfer mating pair stabilization protein TraG